MAKQLIKICFCTLLMLASSYCIFGQDLLWRLINCEGDIILTRDGKRTVYQNNASKPLGILLGAKDMVQTGKGTAELSLFSAGSGGSAGAAVSGVSLRLSENTSVIIDSLTGGISLELLYGRLFVQSNTALAVKTGNSSSYFHECDAELNYISRPGVPQPALIINCFNGEGELTANINSGPEGARFPIRNAESLSLEYQVPFIFIERKSLASPPLKQEIACVEPYRDPEPLRVPMESSQNNRDKTIRIKNGYIVTALLLIGAGAAMQSYSHLANPKQELSDSLFYGGYGALGLGAVFLIGAAALKPPAGSSY